MINKHLMAIILIITVILSSAVFTVSAEGDMSIKSFNATSSAVIVNLDTTNDILPDSIADKVKLYVYDKGENTEVSSTVTATKNSLVITPAMGIETNKYYFVEISAGVCDSEANAVEGNLRTNWFTVEIIYSEDFNVVFDDELNPVAPYHYDTTGTIMKHSGWIVDIGVRNSITLPGKVPSVTKENGTDTVLGFNNGGFAVLDNNTLPADYTVEYVYNFPLSYNYANIAYATHRMRVGAPNKDNRNSGIGIKFGNDHNKSAHTSTVELVIAGYSGDLSTYKHEGYNFGSETINARISAVGDHFQWFSDNVKLFDISGIPAGSGTVAFVDGCWPDQGMPYIDDVVITKYTDMGSALPALSITDCAASEHKVKIEFSDEVDESTLEENINIFKDGEVFSNFDISTSGNFVYIDLPVNDGSFYRIDVAKGICSADGFALNDEVQYEFEDAGGTLIYRVIQKPEIDNVSVVLLNDTQEIKVTYDFTANYAECTSYEISTSATAGGVYTTAFSGEINNAQLIAGGGDIFKDKYIKITLHPEDSHGYLGDVYTESDIPGFMSPQVSNIVVSGKVEDGVVSITYTFSDENSDNNVSEIVWFKADTPEGTYTPIAGENSAALTTTGELYDKFIKVQITAKSDKYPTEGNVITSDVISRVFKPIATEVKIIGESLVDETLTPDYKYYDYNGKAESGTVWKWMISDTIDGTYLGIGTDNQPSYTITEGDIGKFLKLCVVPAKEGVTGDSFYSEVFVLPAPPQALNVAVSGTAEYGYTVAGKYDYFQPGGVKEKDSVYAWYVNGELVSNERNYTIKKDDAGKSLVFEVTPKAEKEPGTGTTVKSAAVTIAKIETTGGGGGGSSSGSSGGGTISISGINKVMNDINTSTKLTEQNGTEYITAFTDIKNSKYIKQIVYLSDLDIIKGTSATTFEPERDITRAEAAALICRALNLTSSQKDPAYSDVPADAWYAGYINSITDNGFMCGYNGLFRPDDVITIEEMTKVMILVYESEFEPVEVYEGTELPNDASDWSGEYLKKALEMGWYFNASSIKPLNNSIREMAAYLLYNAMGFN